MAKRYYWLKLKNDFFDDETIRFIEEQENGIKYSNFYLKLCLKSLQTDGRLIRLVGDTLIPYDIKSLANLTMVDVDTVNSAMLLFQKIGLVKVLETGEIYLSQIEEMIGSETDKAQIMRRKRAEEKLIGNNVTEMLPECYLENRDIENRDKEIYINNNQYNIKELDKSNSMSDFSSPTSKKSNDFSKVADKWNELSDLGLNKVTKINPTTNRGKMLKARLKEYSLDDVLKAIDNVKQSDFLLGNNNRGWMITFDWFVKPNNFVKVLEGNYNNSKPTAEDKPVTTDHKDTKSAAMEIFGEF